MAPAPVHAAPLLRLFLQTHFHPANYNSARMLPALWEQIERLYGAGACRFLLLEVGPLGCTPEYLSLSVTCTGGDRDGGPGGPCRQCHAGLNELVEAHNRDVADFLAPRFQVLAPDAVYRIAPTFDALKAIAAAPAEHGFKHNRTACCGDPDDGPGGGLQTCQDSASRVCDDYVWFDAYHPSHRTNALLADSVWDSVAELVEAPAPDAAANTTCKCTLVSI